MAKPVKQHKPKNVTIAKAIESSLSRYSKKALELTAVGTLMYGIVVYAIPYLDRQWNSDQAPLEGKNEHLADLKKEELDRQARDRAHDDAQVKITQQLDTTANTLAAVVTKQNADYRDGLAQQLERAQSALNTAKAFYEKDPSGANEAVVEALRARLMELQKQVMETAK